MNKVVLKILQGSVVSQTTLGGHPPVANLLLCVPKIVEIGWKHTKLLQQWAGLIFGPPWNVQIFNLYDYLVLLQL